MISSSFFFSKQFKSDAKFTISTNASLWMSLRKQALIVNNISGKVNELALSPSASIGFNWNDNIEFRPSYRLYISQANYKHVDLPSLYAPNHNFDAEFIARWPQKFVWETNMSYRENPGAMPGMPKNNALWNAGLTYSLLKDDRGLLRLSIYDILNNNKDYYRQASQNYIIDHRSNILQRYFLLTFTYNFRTMGEKGKIGGRERLFWF